MTWPIEEAYEALIRALLVFKEVHGEKATIHFLEQETTREVVLHKLRADRQPAIAAPAGDANGPRHLDMAADALAFYADQNNWRPVGGRQSAVQRDKGARARDALAEIAGDESEAE